MCSFSVQKNAAITSQIRKGQPGGDSLNSKRVRQMDVQCTSTPGCSLEELIRQLEEPVSPTFRLADLVSTQPPTALKCAVLSTELYQHLGMLANWTRLRLDASNAEDIPPTREHCIVLYVLPFQCRKQHWACGHAFQPHDCPVRSRRKVKAHSTLPGGACPTCLIP
jgi:hypothetical protein